MLKIVKYRNASIIISKIENNSKFRLPGLQFFQLHQLQVHYYRYIVQQQDYNNYRLIIRKNSTADSTVGFDSSESSFSQPRKYIWTSEEGTSRTSTSKDCHNEKKISKKKIEFWGGWIFINYFSPLRA
jgi:hypothetical protein